MLNSVQPLCSCMYTAFSDPGLRDCNLEATQCKYIACLPAEAKETGLGKVFRPLLTPYVKRCPLFIFLISPVSIMCIPLRKLNTFTWLSLRFIPHSLYRFPSPSSVRDGSTAASKLLASLSFSLLPPLPRQGIQRIPFITMVTLCSAWFPF